MPTSVLVISINNQVFMDKVVRYGLVVVSILRLSLRGVHVHIACIDPGHLKPVRVIRVPTAAVGHLNLIDL